MSSGNSRAPASSPLTDGERRALYAALPALEALSERAATYPGELPRGI
ncbi:hypothetical protein ACIRQP_16375 [Streptomyces sp. NPDC102274]